MKRSLFLLFFFSAFSLFAQTAAEMDVLLETKAVTAATAARFVLEAAELLPPELSGAGAESAAYEAAHSKGWLKAQAGQALTLKDTALLVMRAFDFKGGIMYSLFHTPRYAYREMVYRKLIQGRANPSMKVSGQRLLQIIDRSLARQGKDEQPALAFGEDE